MLGQTLKLVLLAAIVLGGIAFFAFRQLGDTNRKFDEVEASFNGQCEGAFGPHVSKPVEFCDCLWREVRGENRMDMLKRLTSLNNGTEDERRAFMTRASNDCARRLRIERR